MAVLKVIELLAESPKSWEDAAQVAVSKAAKTLKNVRSVWIQEFTGSVNAAGKIEKFRVNAKISFEVTD